MQRRTHTQTDLAEFRTVQNGGKAGRVSVHGQEEEEELSESQNTGRVS
jgi:hypothetical protein